MAIVKGWAADLKISGKLGDLVFSQRGGKTIIRTKGEVSKATMRKSPKFAGVRRAQGQFGLASSLSKQFRISMKTYWKEWKHSRTHNSMMKALEALIRQSDAGRDEKFFDPHKLSQLEGVGLEPRRALLVLHKNIKVDRDSGCVHLRISYGKLRKLFGEAPLPLKLVLGVIALSKAHPGKPPSILHRNWHGQSAFNSKKLIREWPESGELRLRVKLKMKEAMPEGVGMLAVLGVTKYEGRNGKYEGRNAEGEIRN